MSQRHTVRATDLSWREVDDEIVVLDLTSSKYLSLNGTGALLWMALVDGKDDDELVGLLVERFEIPRERAAADVTAFLEHCAALGIVE